MKYSTNSELAKKVCDQLGYIYSIGFIQVAQKGKNIFINFTLGKDHEILDLYKTITNTDKKLNYRLSPDFVKFLKIKGWLRS